MTHKFEKVNEFIYFNQINSMFEKLIKTKNFILKKTNNYQYLVSKIEKLSYKMKIELKFVYNSSRKLPARLLC